MYNTLLTPKISTLDILNVLNVLEPEGPNYYWSTSSLRPGRRRFKRSIQTMLRYSHKIIVQVVSSYFFDTVFLCEQVNFT